MTVDSEADVEASGDAVPLVCGKGLPSDADRLGTQWLGRDVQRSGRRLLFPRLEAQVRGRLSTTHVVQRQDVGFVVRGRLQVLQQMRRVLSGHLFLLEPRVLAIRALLPELQQESRDGDAGRRRRPGERRGSRPHLAHRQTRWRRRCLQHQQLVSLLVFAVRVVSRTYVHPCVFSLRHSHRQPAPEPLLRRRTLFHLPLLRPRDPGGVLEPRDRERRVALRLTLQSRGLPLLRRRHLECAVRQTCGH